MFNAFIISAILASAAAYAPASRMAHSSAIKMSAEGMVGQLPPAGFFDPLNLSEGKTPEELRKVLQ